MRKPSRRCHRNRTEREDCVRRLEREFIEDLKRRTSWRSGDDIGAGRRLDIREGVHQNAYSTSRGSGWEGDEWQLTTDVLEGLDDGLVLFGYASSGTGGIFGKTVRLVSRQFSLGHRPKLSYVRRLNLSAAVNILRTANIRVLVEGVLVDEVSAVGMDYEEASWTERTDIDLMRFAGRTVTLTFEVAANVSVFIEVFAKAWGASLCRTPR